MKIAAALAVAAASLALLAPTASANTALDNLAADLVGQPTAVRCDPIDASGLRAGDTQLDEHWVRLYGYCPALVRSFRGDYSKWRDLGTAALVLTHEAVHQRLQSADEGLVECTAVRNVWRTVRLLHLPPRVERLVYAAALDSHARIHDPRYRAVC